MKITLSDIDMEVELIGSGKTILLLHGLGLNRSIWRKMTEQYQDQARFVLPDLRGHGETNLGIAEARMEQFAEDIRDLMDELKLEKVYLGGHSMGGYIALAFAELFPERLEGLVLITTNARTDPAEKKLNRLKEAEEVLSKGSEELARSLSLRSSAHEAVQKTTYEIVQRTDPCGLSNVQVAIANRPKRIDAIRKLDCPVLVIAGKEDQIASRELAEEMRDNAKDGHIVIIPEVGHMPMLESPEILGALLAAF